MPLQWTGLGPEVLIRLDRDGGEALRAQLERELRSAIRNGQLAPGQQLPSSRLLAGDLGVSRGLVTEAYAQLQAEGFLMTRAGSATRVAQAPQQPLAPRLSATQAARPAIDFATGVPDLNSFPRGDWTWALRESCRRASVAELGYGDPRGTTELREVLTAYLRRVRAAAVDAEQVLVCAGFAQGINLALQTLSRHGVRRLAIEDPGDDDYIAIAARNGIEAVSVPVDEQGVDVEALAASGARALVITPTHQFPTGVALAPERRRALVRWAIEQDAMVIEDDYDAEFRYDREPVGALQGLAPNRVMLLGTVSKSLAPALRIGWVVCPPALLTVMTEEKALMDRGSPTLEQLALAALIESGRYDRHLRRMRAIYARKRDALITTLAARCPEVTLHGLAAGFHCVAHLPDSSDEASVISAARERSVGLQGMSRYRSSGATQPTELVLGFGDLSEEAIVRGITLISDLL